MYNKEFKSLAEIFKERLGGREMGGKAKGLIRAIFAVEKAKY
jgi:hypothetical protein